MTTDTVAVWAETTRATDRQPIMGSTKAASGLPWPHTPVDLAHFREVTRERTLIMGRRTFDLLPPILKSRRSLDERPMIVLTREKSRLIDEYPGLPIQPIAWATDEALARELLPMARNWYHKELAVIGGRKVIELFAPLVDRLEVTFFHERRDGDVLAPSAVVFDGFRSHHTVHGPVADFVTFTKENHRS
jgi:dihydrofolate reductase